MKIAVENGCFGYRKGEQLLQNVSLEASDGELVAILGPNGAGKTTMLRCMMGFLHWKSGRSAIDGKDIRSISQRELWRTIAYVPQAKNTSAAYTAGEMVLLGRSSRIGVFSQPGAGDVQMADQVMERLGILHLKEKKCSEISGGELQMVLIARALASQPRILVLDEPESNLDFKNQLIVLETLSRLAAEGMICLFNTHYPAHALQRAGKSFLLCKDGSSIFGPTREVVTEANIRRAFGVQAVIGEVETPENVLRSVLPVGIVPEDWNEMEDAVVRSIVHKIASITILTNDYGMAGRINEILHRYSELIIGRMGMPYKKAGVYFITVALDGTEAKIHAHGEELSLLPGVSVKTVFAREEEGIELYG